MLILFSSQCVNSISLKYSSALFFYGRIRDGFHILNNLNLKVPH